MNLQPIVVKPLTRERVEQHLIALLELDRTVLGEPWTQAHFLAELPGKWTISHSGYTQNGVPAGFIIGSIKPAGAHIHRIAVGTESRRQGLATRLMAAAAAAVQQQNIQRITAKVHKQNSVSQAFMGRLGWKVTGQQDDNYLLEIASSTLLANAGSERV